MPVRIGTAIFHDWKSLQYRHGQSDTFVFNMSSFDGLPPNDYAEVVYRMLFELRRMRSTASVWVSLDAPGTWYLREVKRSLRKTVLPVAVTEKEREPELSDYNYLPWGGRYNPLHPFEAGPLQSEVSKDLDTAHLLCLRVLARVQFGFPTHIASLTGFDKPRVVNILRELGGRKLVYHENGVKYPYWKITRKGKTEAFRSWGLPAGYVFYGYKERHRHELKKLRALDLEERRVVESDSLGQPHQRKSRLFGAWLKKAWGDRIELWASWSEVKIPGLLALPDAIAWGKYDGFETLFWLEVESGHRSTENIRRKISRSLHQAIAHADDAGIHLVFIMLAMPWVQEAGLAAFENVPSCTAGIVGNWNQFGELPNLQWGSTRFYKTGKAAVQDRLV